MNTQKADLEQLIFKLLGEKNTITLQDIAIASGLSAKSPTDRRAIQRILLIFH